MNTAEKPVMIVAGGTGGHVIPALEVARVLRERGIPVVWMGTRRGLEARLVPAANIAIEWISIEGWRGKGMWSLLCAPLKLLRACAQVWRILHRLQPRAVLGMGGFVAGPGGLVAWLTGRPLVLHEQNALPGMTNKLLRPLARTVLQAIPGAFPGAAQTVGNPVRREMCTQDLPRQRLQGRCGPLRLLVVGGSQGARALNQIVPASVALLACALAVRHQAGAGNVADVHKAYASNDAADIQLNEFIDDIPSALAWADVVVCRSGAMTVAELAAVGVASILVPFAHAVDDHQTANAQPLHKAGAAILCQESALSADWLAQQLRLFANDRRRLLAMAENARQLAKPDSAERVAEVILAVSQ